MTPPCSVCGYAHPTEPRRTMLLVEPRPDAPVPVRGLGRRWVCDHHHAPREAIRTIVR